MNTVTLTYRGKMLEHKIYTREEADAASIQYRSWREVPSGDWALTDDGYVVQCLYVKEYASSSGKVRTMHVFAFWNIWNSPTAKLFYGGYEARQKESAEREKRRIQTGVECARILREKGITKDRLNAMFESARKVARKKKSASSLLRLADFDARALRKMKEQRRQRAWRAKRE